MPYENVSELPSQFDQYGEKGRRAALDALNGCMYEGDRSESDCFKIAHAAAKRAGGRAEGQQRTGT